MSKQFEFHFALCVSVCLTENMHRSFLTCKLKFKQITTEDQIDACFYVNPLTTDIFQSLDKELPDHFLWLCLN